MFAPIADLIFALVTQLTGVLGGSVGLAIVILTVALRLALLPLTRGIARRTYEQREIRKRLQPELERLRDRYAGDPGKSSEILGLYRRHGYQPIIASSIVGFLAQALLFGGFFSAIRRGLGAGVRFLSIANLGSPSFVMAVVVAVLSYVGVLVNAPQQGNTLAVLIPVFIIMLVAWKVSAAMAVHWASSSLVALLQSIWVQRNARKQRQGAAA